MNWFTQQTKLSLAHAERADGAIAEVDAALVIAAIFNVIAALMAIFVLKPMRVKPVTRAGGAWPAGAQPT